MRRIVKAVKELIKLSPDNLCGNSIRDRRVQRDIDPAAEKAVLVELCMSVGKFPKIDEQLTVQTANSKRRPGQQ